MEELNMKLPNEIELYKMSKEDIDILGVDINKTIYQLLAVVENIVKSKLAPILEKHPEIQAISLDAKYQYDDEGYSPNNIMPWINEEIEYYEQSYEYENVRTLIDNELQSLSHLIKEDIYIDSKEVLTKFLNNKLNTNLKEKNNTNPKTKI